jgi:hypothetical protein
MKRFLRHKSQNSQNNDISKKTDSVQIEDNKSIEECPDVEKALNTSVEVDFVNKKLPKELLIRIFSYLDIVSLCRCAQVSKVIVTATLKK